MAQPLSKDNCGLSFALTKSRPPSTLGASGVVARHPRASNATPVIRFARWYWRGLKKLPAVTLGYCIGVFVGAMMAQFPALARAALAMAG